MKLLLTNDDGINAVGLFVLAKELEKSHEVLIVAPKDQRSACGHSITLTRPLLVKEVKLEGINSKAFFCDGTPADCVRVGIDKIANKQIDMVISGINYGFNLGTDVLYSGTVSAAIEAAVYKVPSIAISMEETKDEEKLEVGAKVVGEILHSIKEAGIKEDVVLNVNVPLLATEENKGIKVCKIGSRTYENWYIETLTEENEMSLELKGELRESAIEDTDTYYIKEGYATVTPLHYDLTNFKIIKEIEEKLSK